MFIPLLLLPDAPECRKIYKKEYRTRRQSKKYSNGDYICESCGKHFNGDWRNPASRHTPPRFCSNECSHRRNFSQESKEKTAAVLRKRSLERKGVKLKGNEILEDLRNLNKNYYSEKRKFEKKKKEKKYKYPENCVLGRFERSLAYERKPDNLIRLGFDFNGRFEDEFFKVRNLLYKVYYEEKKSILEMVDIFGFKSPVTPPHMLQLFGLNKRRNLKEGIINSYVQGRSEPSFPSIGNYQFKHGWIDTQFGKFYYRSSYELNLINYLINKNIRFTCNEFKITYLSSKDNLIHAGYPDFYLPDYNLIVETKNKSLLDEIDLKDRYERIKEKNLDYIIIRYDEKPEVFFEFIEFNEKEKIYELPGIA